MHLTCMEEVFGYSELGSRICGRYSQTASRIVHALTGLAASAFLNVQQDLKNRKRTHKESPQRATSIIHANGTGDKCPGRSFAPASRMKWRAAAPHCLRRPHGEKGTGGKERGTERAATAAAGTSGRVITSAAMRDDF